MFYSYKKNILFVVITLFSIITSVLIFAFGEKLNSDDMLNKYKEKLKMRYEDPITLDIKLSKKELEGWNGLKARLKVFREACKTLYDPIVSPFNKTITNSSNPESFSATSKSGSKSGNYSIQVLQIAKKDKIASNPIKKDKKLKGGIFTIKSGGDVLKIDFSKGGTLEDLNNIFDKLKTKLVTSSVTMIDTENEMLILEVNNEGLKNKLTLDGDKNLLREIGFLKSPNKKLLTEKHYKLKDLKKHVFNGNYSIENEVLVINEKSKIAVTLPNPVSITKTSILESEIKLDKVIKKKDEITITNKTKNNNNKKTPIGTIDEVKVGRIKLFGEPLISEINGEKQPETKKEDDKNKIKSDDQFIVILKENNEEIFKIKLEDTKGSWQKLKIEIGKDLKDLSIAHKLLFQNDSIDKLLSIKKLNLFDPAKKTSNENYNYITEAQDAKFLLNGVQITRDKNLIDDAIRGITLTLKSPSNKQETLNVTNDYDKIVEDIQKFIDEYNNAMLYLKNVTDFTPKKKLDEILKEEEQFERKSFEEKQFAKLSGDFFKGTMNRDFTARTLKVRLRQYIASTPYSMNIKKAIKFLIQIGIKNPDHVNESVDNENLKAGYLYVDKKVLKDKLETHFDEVKDLFAHTEEGSIIKNNGIAVKLVELIDAYIKRTIRNKDKSSTKGICQIKIEGLESKIKFLDKRFDRAADGNKKRLALFVRKIKRMEEAEEKGKRMKARIDSLNPNNNNR